MHHLFFDLDGTLTDPAPGITACLAYAVERMGRVAPPSEALLRFIGPPLREALGELLETDDAARIEEGVRRYRERFASVGLFENAVYPGIERALADLAGDGFRLSVVTSKPEVYASRIIDHFALRPFFGAVHGAELSGARSHKAELVAHALRAEGASPARACMIGDRRHDVLGAAAHGVPAIGVSWGYGSAAELSAAGAALVVDAVAELAPACRAARARASTATRP